MQPAKSSITVHLRAPPLGTHKQPSRRPLGRELRLSLPILSYHMPPTRSLQRDFVRHFALLTLPFPARLPWLCMHGDGGERGDAPHS